MGGNTLVKKQEMAGMKEEGKESRGTRGKEWGRKKKGGEGRGCPEERASKGKRTQHLPSHL